MLTVTPTNEANAETGTRSLTAEIEIRKCSNLIKTLNTFLPLTNQVSN